MKESIIITYHKNKDMLLFCLNRLLKTTPDDVEILIIGNNVNKAELDVDISIIINKLELEDLLIITADHGNDPTFKGNDHTRENVPVIIYSRNFKEPKRLKPFETFANIGATIADNFDIDMPEIGESILKELK